MYLGDVFVKMERRRKNKKSVRGEVQKMMEVDAILKDNECAAQQRPTTFQSTMGPILSK